MSTIFPLSASVGQEFQGYMYDGTIWNLIGNEYNPTTFSSTPPANPKPGDLWVDKDSNVNILSEENLVYSSDLNDYLTIQSASSTYATKIYVDTAIDNIPEIDLTNYATKSYADNSASVAAAAVVDAAPETLNTLNELAAALNDDENFAGTVTTALGNKLYISTASASFIPQNAASANQLVYKNSSNVATGSSGLTYDGTSIKVNGNLESVYHNGDEGGEIFLHNPDTNTTLSNGVTIDVFRDKLRIFESGSPNRGMYVDISTLQNDVSSEVATTGKAIAMAIVFG